MTRRIARTAVIVTATLIGVAARTRASEPIAVPAVLTVSDAVALALQASPRLAAWPPELRALDASARQAGRRPNPRLAGVAENIATESVEYTLQISHTIELGAKRARRAAAARADMEIATWEFESARADVAVTAARSFIDALAERTHVAVEHEFVRVAQEALDAVDARVRAGGASEVEASRARVALEQARLDLMTAEHERDIAFHRLAASWGDASPRFTEVDGDLEVLPDLLPLDSLRARVERSPDIARWTAEIARRERVRDATRAARVPDLDLDIGVRRLTASRETGLVAGAAVPLALFDRSQGALAAAERRGASAAIQREAMQREATARLGVAHAEAAAAAAEYRRMESDLLPSAASAHEAANSAYRRGVLRLTDVLDAQRTLFEIRRRTIDTLVRYHTAAFEIERLTGMPAVDSDSKEQR